MSVGCHTPASLHRLPTLSIDTTQQQHPTAGVVLQPAARPLKQTSSTAFRGRASAPDCGVVLRPAARPLHHLWLPRPLPGGHRLVHAVKEVQADLRRGALHTTLGAALHKPGSLCALPFSRHEGAWHKKPCTMPAASGRRTKASARSIPRQHLSSSSIDL